MMDRPWIMAGGHDIANGILERCRTAAEALERGEYAVMRLQLNGESRTDRWLIPGPHHRQALPEIRIKDDPVRLPPVNDRIIMECVARALKGKPMSHDEGNRSLAALRAIVASEGLVDRCSPARRRTLMAALPTTWGAAAARDLSSSAAPVYRMGARSRPCTQAFPIGHAATALPSCTLVRFANEPEHFEHIRIETITAACTDENAPDAVGIIRTLADLAANPFE